MLQSLFTTLLDGLGLIALIALTFGMVERSIRKPLLYATVQGSIFGVGAVAAMLTATVLPGGIIIDARAVVLGLGAAFCGWLGAVPALLIAATYRLWLGGGGAPVGIATMTFAVVVGLVWGRRFTNGQAATVPSLILLALALSLHVGFFAFLPVPDPLAIIVPVLILAIPGYSVGTVVMGTLMQRERRMMMREQSLEVHAMTDPLTGLANRRAYQLIVEEELRLLRLHRSRTKRGEEAPGLAILIVDIDLFKRVNDTFGHEAGDHVLRAVAQVLRAGLGPSDYLCRHGGEEFCAVLPSANIARAMSVAERMRATVADLKFERPEFDLAAHPVRVSVSIGVAVAPEHGNHANVLYAHADGALYQAKSDGRDRVAAARSIEAATSETASIGPLDPRTAAVSSLAVVQPIAKPTRSPVPPQVAAA